MHFYCFLYIFMSDFADFTVFFSVFRVVRFISLSLLRVSIPHKPAVGSGALRLSSQTASSLTHKNTQMMIAAHPGIEPGATPFVVGGVLLAILTDRQQPKNKNTWIMICGCRSFIVY